MSDYGRYDYEITTGDRSYGDRKQGGRSSGGGYSRNSESMFNYDGSRDRDRDRGSDRGDDRMGGWAGSGRTSAYDSDDDRGRWTETRENLGSDHDHDHDRHEHRGRSRVYRSHDDDRDRGKRMSSGWGGLAGEKMGRDRDRSRDLGREENRYGRDDERGGLPLDETSRLIASNKVEGTSVYGRDGERLGSIYNFMVGKRSGKVEYAVMSYGGFLGMGQRYYPLPWDMLSYDTREGGYHVPMSEDDLRDAPSFDRDSEPKFNRDYDRHVHSYYGTKR